MKKTPTHQFVRIRSGKIEHGQRQVVEEIPLLLRVNGRELTTLICSPHQLNYLLTGFLYLQGFIDSLDDIQNLGICADSGLAEVRISRELPERLRPTLTSGCGSGISFNLPTRLQRRQEQPEQYYSLNSPQQLMKKLNKLSERYRSHGGIHSAAIGDQVGNLLLHAEDIGRHNTLDRLAGEALFRNIELRNLALITSGRVSTEMVAKAARLGIGLIASRTSPTNKAIELCEQAGITLVGYLRGASMEIYSHPQQLQLADAEAKISGVTGVILAGGESHRMGSDKSLLPVAGGRFIDHVYQRMARLFDEVLIVTNAVDLYNDIPCRKVPDIYPSQGALAGIHSGLVHARNENIFVAGCDMPFISSQVIREICSHADAGDLVLPHTSNGHEPLHALYGRGCLPAMEQVLDSGQKRIMLFFGQVKLIELPATLIQQLDPQELSFQNINTPEDYFRLRGTLINAETTRPRLKTGQNN